MSRAASLAMQLLTEAGITTIPVSVERLIKHLGISLTYEPYDGDLSGLLFRDGATTVIGINASDAKTRQRFTIAHEIGHLRLHNNRPMFVDKTMRLNFRNTMSSLGTNTEEVEANAFAAELLMPESHIEKEFNRAVARLTDVNVDTVVHDLAKRFGVSSQAMEIRLANLGYLSPS
jgi:Zn-dependent peptidase ImmA (M78 family)